jgi:chitin synthase
MFNEPSNRNRFADAHNQNYQKIAASDRPIENFDLYTAILVTCYSEGEKSIRDTLDSLANTVYDDRKKLLFVVADGLITGKGNAKSTPELIIDMIDVERSFGTAPKPYSYVAVASDSKQHNMAQVYVGYYRMSRL